MYVIILYSNNKNKPYVYDVVNTILETDEIISKFEAVKFDEYNDDTYEDENEYNFLRLVDIDTSYKWYHIGNKHNDFYKSTLGINKSYNDMKMIIIEKRNYTVSEILQDEMFSL